MVKDTRVKWIERAVCTALDIEFSLFENWAAEDETQSLNEFFDTATPDTCFTFALNEDTGELMHAVSLPRSAVQAFRGKRQIYFCKSVIEPITNCDDDAQLEFGVLTGNALGDLGDILREIYIPLLDSAGPPSSLPVSEKKMDDDDVDEDSESEEDRVKSKNQRQASTDANLVSLNREMKSSIQKFESQIQHALGQVKGEVLIYVPDIKFDLPEDIVDDFEAVSRLEEALDEWAKAIAAAVDQESKKVPQGGGPLGEIEFWRNRNAALSVLYEQINMPDVQKMLKALEIVDEKCQGNINMLSTFRFHFQELSKLYVEAKDNVKFLATLERHFKNISTGSLGTILETLPSMINAIRMVWIISRHYNTDERMVPLMERIGCEISEKVAQAIDIRIILRGKPEQTLKTVDEAKTVLESWYKTYLMVREKIEQSGTDHRWEFDRKRLFEQTNYMAKICENLYEVAMVLDQFNKFLGPELKAVTGDAEGIDEVIRRVDALIAPLEEAPMNIFDRRYKTSWDSVMAQFREKVDAIEEMTKSFIDTSFQKLRSAEGAFDLLQKFQNIESRESINRQMMQKFDDILVQYGKELERVRQIFAQEKEHPIMFKNYPPVAGSIAWAQHLYYRTKRPIMRFKKMDSLFEGSKTWEGVMHRYIEFAKDIKEFCKAKYDGWQDKANSTSLLLQQPILGPALVAIEEKCIRKNQEEIKVVHVIPEGPFYVNFSECLVQLIRETKYLDRMGYKVPETALNVALQEDKYHGYVQSLKDMLQSYEAVLGKLTPVETRLVSRRLQELQEELKQGFDPCNWCSLHIPTLIERCMKAISEFQGVVNQIHKSSALIDEVIVAIESTHLINWNHFAVNITKSAASSIEQTSEDSDGTMEISTVYELLDQARVEKVNNLVRQYHSIGPLLVKIEEIVAFSNTGVSPVLAEFYKYWERRVYNAITTMVIRGMTSFEMLLNLDPRGNEDNECRAPLIKVHATLNGSDLSVLPALNDIYKYVSKMVRSIVESSKSFYRWMRGSCKETEPLVVSEDEDPIVFSFYQDISQNQQVIKMMMSLNHSFQRTFTMVRKYLDTWQRYDHVYGLWDAKKRDQLNRLKDKGPSAVFFDNRISIYDKLSQAVWSQAVKKDIDFLRLDCYAVAAGLSKKSHEWKVEYGRIQYELAKGRLQQMLSKVSNYRVLLEKDPQDLEELKIVLNAIARISEASLTQELDIADIMEHFRTLSKYKLDQYISDAIPVDDANDVMEQFESARVLDKTWYVLTIDAKTKDLRMNQVKDTFRKVTQSEAEEFVDTARQFQGEFKRMGPGTKHTGDNELDEGVELIGKYLQQLQTMDKRREQIVNAQRLFNLDIMSYPELNTVKVELGKLQQIYGLYAELKKFEREMSGMLWSELDVHALSKGADDLEKTLRKFPKELRGMQTFVGVEESIIRFRDSIPLIQTLKNDSMKKRHWDALSKVTGVSFDMDPKKFTLGALFEMKLARYETEIAEIVNEGVQEAKIEKSLKEIEDKWKVTDFGVAKYKKGTVDKGFVLRACDDIKLELEDNMLNLQTMAGSRFVLSFSDVVRKWEKQLNHVSETIDVWFKVQSKWMYLESIFIGAEDIRMQLPEEAKKFDQVDKAFKGVMVGTSKLPNVIEACHAENRIETLKALSERLDLCQKSLSDYLDTKRGAFPRFFFISDDELLSVLGSSDPTGIQIHMLKLFDNTKSLKFARGAKSVGGMGSSENEEFSFVQPATVEGPVEVWMTGVESEMRQSLQAISKEGVFNYAQTERVDWVDQCIGMTTILGSQIWWTWETEDVFRRVRDGNKHAMKLFADKLTGQLNDLVVVVRKDISGHMRKKVNALLIIDVHARDIVDTFVRDSILDEREFAWESQLRFYWDQSTDDCLIRQCTGSFKYGYEFMGLNGRLVITPLTDRCYMTITQAHTFNLGTAPAGPAGTGKTETVKDLAKSMALPCFVINCGEGLDYKAMGSIFSGLAQIGAWGCFDEFNRINIEVLSVVSAQLQAIQGGLKTGKKKVDIGMGQEIGLDPKIGIFVTMNPGYAGRTELPDNLKALFRPVTMIVPDLLQICEIMLFSEGFGLARVLAKKMTTLYSLAKGQLSKQYHYDFGLRALKSVLVMAGGLKRQYSEMPEDLVLMRALRDSNMPKFVFDDVPLFQGLIADLFPGLDCPRVAFEVLKVAIEDYFETNTFRHSEETAFQLQVDKVIQMYETMLTRHTCMIVGPTGGGKTVVLECLQSAQAKAFDQHVKMLILNPKAQSLPELYGELDPVTRDWTDGVLSKLFREMNEPLPAGRENELRWLIFDGDVDALWIENMNSVMDDNRLLTLPNGERIRLQNHCKLIMETFDLQFASPATISRCGMVYVDPKNLGYRPYYERWVKTRDYTSGADEEENVDHAAVEEARVHSQELLLELFDTYVPKCIDFVLEGLVDDEIVERPVQVIPITNLSMLQQLCSLMDAMLASHGLVEIGNREVQSRKVLNDGDIEGLFVFAVTWGIGGQLVQGYSREEFHNAVTRCSSTGLPSSLYDAFYDVTSGKWESWESKVPDYAAPSPFEFAKIMVPTKENILYTHLLRMTKVVEKPVLFVGDPGTAKTVTIQNFLDSQPAETHVKLNLNFSSRTTSYDVQNNIVDNVDKRSGRIYGPPAGKQLLIFIDDMNMPIVDTYGTQAPNTLLLMLVSHGAMYDRGKDLDLRIYKDLQFFAAMGPPGGGRNNVDPRFVGRFNVYNLTPPSERVLTHIYDSILSTFLRDRFDDSIIAAGSKITPATLRLYNELLVALPPTPSKFHYVFNLRDLGRIFEGLCLATPDEFDGDVGGLVRLWRNECSRVFFDRLISEEDQQFSLGVFQGLVQECFPDKMERVMTDPLIFGDFEDAAARLSEDAEDAMIYKDLNSFQSVRKVFDEVLEIYNVDNKPMSLVLFEMAIEHLCRIYRVLRLPVGHCLLVGVGGSGKQSLTKLATFACGYSLFEVTLSRGYSEKEFRDDLKNLYKMLGEGPVTFLFTDAHVVEEGFLELINNMLTTGMVPALFENDEKDAACNAVRKEAKEAGLFDTKDNLWAFYVAKCRQNLHIVLAMSPSGETLRVRCRNFPGLISGCVIDWFFPWPADALRSVANFFLQDQALPDENRINIVDHMVLVHQGVIDSSDRFYVELRRRNYVTPKNFLDYIANYRSGMKDNKRKMEESVKRLGGGLTKLNEAETSVDAMSKELATKKVVVDAKTKDCQAMIKDIDEKQTIASEKQEAASLKKSELEESNEIIVVEKGKADEQLLEALPALEAAAEALDSLDKNDITEIKAFASPPPAVAAVLGCVLYLRPTGTEDESGGWKAAKAMMGQGNFLAALKAYDKDAITEKMIKKVKVYFRDPDFNMDVMRKVSKAGAGLFQWVIAIVKYHEVARNVEPLKLKVRELEKQKASAEKELGEIMQTLGELEIELAELNKNFSAANAELTALRGEAQLMEKRLTAASKLIVGLSSEKLRWGNDIKTLESKTVQLVGDCLLGASFLSYLGVFTAKYRRELLADTWVVDLKQREIPLSSDFKIETLLTNDVEIQMWNGEGLPADDHSIENGILTTNASRFPLCIDPQQQAVKWIKKKEAKHKLTVRTFSDADFMKHLELAIQFGNPFLFENVDEDLDPMIEPVLEKNTVIENGQRMILLGDKKVDWDPNFRLYLTTKLANPHYTPEVMGKTMIINYSVTIAGLADQLLNVVVGHERSDIEEKFAEIVTQMSDNTQALAQLEDTLLKTLASSTGNILDNEELIATLEEAKTKAVDIHAQIENATFTRDEIQIARKQYTPVAKRASILFFALSGLSTIMKMYETSLASFLLVFEKSLDDAKKDNILENRLRNMIKEATRQVYDYTCTGIFERHKLMFSFQMTCMIMEGDDELDRSELDFFLKGDTAISSESKKNPNEWISDSGWKDLLKLAILNPSFQGLVESVESYPNDWNQWYELETPEVEAFPHGWTEKLAPFQRLLLTRCFRPDRVYNAVKLFIMGHPNLGEKFVQPPVLNFQRIYNQSTSSSPMVFILSPGADPASDIQALGLELGFTGNQFKTVSLGQGQGPLALQMLETGASRGHWVLLQNCHLLISWLKELEKVLDTMSKVHDNFRLWMTTDPTDRFPMGILQRSLKVVTEPPDGLKLNMRSTMAKIDESILEECNHPAYRPLVYVLTYLHAVVQERRKYGKIGWNVPYDFNESDFKVSRRLLCLYLNKAVENNDEMIPWGSLKYLIGDAMYGGRVSDNFDRRILVTYVNEYMGDFLFDDCQKFFFSRAGFDYDLPAYGPVELYKEAVEQLPLNCGPSVFGLHPNAEIGYLNSATRELWKDLIDLQPRTASSGGGMSREEVIEQTASSIQSKVPELVDMLVVKKRLGVPSPTEVVLLQELERWNALVSQMNSSLVDLKRALKGEIGMSESLDELATSMFNGFLPGMWRRLCPDTQKGLGSWMEHFENRYQQYMSWIETGEPKVIWLSGLHIPESYLTALVQATCRLKNWPLDKSTLYTKVSNYIEESEVEKRPDYGCYVVGMYLEGAAWDTNHGCLVRQKPKVLVQELPILRVIPIEAAKLKLQDTLCTPVYVTQARRNAMGVGLVFEADLSTGDHPSSWVLQGVSLSLNIDS